MRLLIVEDENDLRNIVKKKKACQGTLQCRCLWGWSGRQREDDTPVLLLTAKDSIEDRVNYSLF